MMNCEEIYIMRIEASIRGLKHGTKQVDDIQVRKWFIKLKPLNLMMYEDLKLKYDKVMLNNKKWKLKKH